MIARRPLLLSVPATLAGARPLRAAGPVEKGGLEFARPWARATAPRQANGAAYLTIHNRGAADRILAARSEVARTVELHTHEVDAQGVARMRRVPAIELPSGGTVELAPGGLHVMLIGLERPLEAGRRFPLTLLLETAGEVTLEVEVRAGSGAAPMQQGAGHGGHGTSN